MSFAREASVAAGAGRELLHAASTAVAARSRAAPARGYCFRVIAVPLCRQPYRVPDSEVMEFAAVRHTQRGPAEAGRHFCTIALWLATHSFTASGSCPKGR